MSDAVIVSLIAGSVSIVTGGLGLLGIWLTKKDVKTVREENSQQHGNAQKEREESFEILRQGYDKILGKVELVHTDVQTVVGTVAVIGDKLADHLKSPH